jgi:DHA1 family multidrug resistance protein-like MFS transporter
MSSTNPTPPPVPWKRNLAVLCLGQLIAIMGFSVFMPFLPYFVQELGITETNQVAYWSGLLISAHGVTMAVVAPIWGSLADRHGRKIMVARAMFGGAVVISLMGLVGNVQQLIVLRAIQGTLTGTVTAATTLVASSTPPHRRGFALGLLQMAIYSGRSVGPLIGGLIADSMGYRPTFWVTGALLFVAGVLVTALVREHFVPPEQSEEARPPLWEGWLLVLRSRALMTVLSLRVMMRMAVRVLGPVLPLFIQAIAASGTRIASLTGTIAGVASAAGAIGAVFLGRLTDRIGSRRVLIACGALACALYAAQAGAQTPAQLLVLRTLASVAMGGIIASISALQASMAPQGRYGAVYGIDTSLVAAANAISPMIGAGLAATFGLRSVFLGAAAIYGLATGVAAWVVPSRRERSE